MAATGKSKAKVIAPFQAPGAAQANPMMVAQQPGSQSPMGAGLHYPDGQVPNAFNVQNGVAQVGSAPTGPGGPMDVIHDQNNTLRANGIDPRTASIKAPAVTAPAGPDYMSQYQASLAQSRQSIAQQLSAALADINGNQGRAQQAIGQLPGQYGQAYGAAQASDTQLAHTLDAHQAASGIGSQTGYSADWLAPEKQAMNGSLAFLNAQVPVLQLGAQSEFAQRRGQANQAALDANSALDQHYQDVLAQQAQQQAGFAHDTQMETMREKAAGVNQSPHAGSAAWWAQQQQTHPGKTNALEGRAASTGFLNDFEHWSPAKQAQYIGSGAVSPKMQSFLQYIVATRAQQAQPKKKTSKPKAY